jgi:biotin/methionine sulfoxide reductase
MTDSGPTTFTPTATHWGNYRVEHVGDSIRAIHPYPADEDPTPIRHNLLAALDPAVRIAQPMVRESYLKDSSDSKPHLRGIDRYVPVDWETALDLAADAIYRVRGQHGNEAIYAGSYGWASAGRFHHAQSQTHRFFRLIGGYTDSANSYSLAAGEVIIPHVLGTHVFQVIMEPPTVEDIAAHCKTVMLFGGAPVKNSQVNPGSLAGHTVTRQLKLMKEAGVAFINVSPVRNDTDDVLGADWVAVRPCSDVALMLGMAHTLYSEELHDGDFLRRYCVGFDRFLPYLLGKSDGIPKTAAWAAAICGIEEARIQGLARTLAEGRSVLGISWSLQRQEHGEQPYWMITVLAAMLGNIGLPGGGLAFGYGCAHNMGFRGRRGLPFRIASVPQGDNPIDTFIPVARISDMLENPGGSVTYNGKTLVYPDIRLIYWAGGNPFHHHQDLNRMRRAWHKPEAIIVNEPFWNAMARHADIVFPATTSLERSDLGADSEDTSMTPMRPVAQPYAQSRSDFDIFKGLADRLGVGREFTEGRSEMEWVEHLYEETRTRAREHNVTMPPFAEFWQGEQLDFADQLEDRSFALERFRSDPDLHPLATPSGKIEIFSDVIAGFDYKDCPGHPAWLEKEERLGAPLSDRFPLHLISNQPRMKLHSQLDHGPASRSIKIKGREPMRINGADASARGIADGDIVRIFNDRGSCLAAAVISDDLRPDVVELATGSWYWAAESSDEKPLELHGNPNVLTRDVGSSSLAQGSTAHSCLVEVERYQEPLPENNVFTPIPTSVREPAT